MRTRTSILRRGFPVVALFSLIALGAGCSDEPATGGTGGAPATQGGAPATQGGTTSNGGSTPSQGGAVTQGGTTSQGGALPTQGGAPANGGTTFAGGKTGSGGTSGGSTASGGGGGTTASGGGGGTTASGGATGGGASGAASGGSGGGGTFTLTSPNHKDGDKFASKYTCAKMGGSLGQGDIPELKWSGAPAGTKSFAMTFIDTTIGEDKAMGQHWAIYNIPATATGIPEAMGAMVPTELMGAKQAAPAIGGGIKYLAPCAQSLVGGMDDQYAFTIYALSTETLNVSMATSVASVLTALKAATPLGTAKLTGHSGLKGM